MLDDATNEIYYAQLVEEESTMTMLRALRKVIEQREIFCALYSDRASDFFWTPRAGECRSYSQQARGRSGRGFGTWQGRLPQEPRLQGIVTLEGANQFLRARYVAEFNRRFRVPAWQPGTAFLPSRRKDLDVVFTVQLE